VVSVVASLGTRQLWVVPYQFRRPATKQTNHEIQRSTDTEETFNEVAADGEANDGSGSVFNSFLSCVGCVSWRNPAASVGLRAIQGSNRLMVESL